MKHVDGGFAVGKVNKKPRKRKTGSKARRRYRAKRRRQIRAAKRAKSHQESVSPILRARSPLRDPKSTLTSSQILFAMSGNSFWLNYNNVFQWKDRYIAGTLSNSPVHHEPEPFHHPWQNQVQKQFSNGTEAPRHHFQTEIDDDGYSDGEDSDKDGEDSEDDIAVSEEMMQFLEISMRHRANREKQKQAAQELEEKRRKNERNTIEKCAPPTESELNEKRRNEMLALYGKEAPTIHGMETALQLSFNHQLSLHNPSYWPIHPFSIHFTGKTLLK